FEAPFIVKHNQGGKGLGVHRFDAVEHFAAHLDSPAYQPPVDGITLVQEYLWPAAPFITRVEIVGGRFVYAITADTGRGGFELCPADACVVRPSPADGGAAAAGDGHDAASGAEPAGDGSAASLFALREDLGERHPIVGSYLRFAARHGIEVAGFEFIETADGRLVTYDVNTNTNYNPDVEALAPRSGPAAVAEHVRDLLAAQSQREAGR
ncbi:MAG: alpha-L-glutamate ligase, partial [Actinocrinis sp.]